MMGVRFPSFAPISCFFIENMLRLLFSLTSRFLFIALLQDKKCLASTSQDNFRQHSEKFFPALQQALAEAGYSLKDIEEVYFTDLPGSQTGQRISLAFVLTLQVLSPQIKIWFQTVVKD